MSLVDPSVFRERFIKAIGTEKMYEWAALHGFPVSSLKTIQRGSVPKAELLAEISTLTGKSIDWLLGLDNTEISTAKEETIGNSPRTAEKGTEAPCDEFVYIPRYDVKASAGTGFWGGCEGEAKFSMAFRKYWVERYLHVAPKDLSVVRVHGDSMSPVLQDGDNILVNHTATTPMDGIYVIRMDEQVLVKRLQRLHGQQLKVISENPSYTSFEVPSAPDDQRGFDIIGRVVWYGRQL